MRTLERCLPIWPREILPRKMGRGPARTRDPKTPQLFYINLPVGVLAALMTNVFVEDPPYLKRNSAGDIDYVGFGLLAIWLPTLQYVLDRGQELDWFASRGIVWCTLISAAAFVAFIARELATDHPIVDLCVLRNRNFALGAGMVLLLGGVLYGTIAILPLFMQNLLGYTALDAGIATSPRGIGAMIGTLLISRLVGRVQNRLLIGVGFLLLACSSFMFGAINVEISMRSVVIPGILNGFAIAMIFVPLTTATTATLPREQIGNATGILT
jgi:DHA2 family multidrug resistance protein